MAYLLSFAYVALAPYHPPLCLLGVNMHLICVAVCPQLDMADGTSVPVGEGVGDSLTHVSPVKKDVRPLRLVRAEFDTNMACIVK